MIILFLLGLKSFFQYKVLVTAVNGVSDQVIKKSSKSVTFITKGISYFTYYIHTPTSSLKFLYSITIS